MDCSYIGFREVTPDQFFPEKWREFTINIGGTQALQETKVPERAGGYAYRNQVKLYTRNRFLYWRVSHDVLELMEHSLDVNLVGNALRYRFEDMPVLEGVSIHETESTVIVLVATVSSVHRLTFPHPDVICPEASADFAVVHHPEIGIKSIFADAKLSEARDPSTYHVINNMSTNATLPHISASLLTEEEDSLFALAYANGGILLLCMSDKGVVTEKMVKQDSYVPRFLSGITSALMGGGRGLSSQEAVSLVLHSIGLESYLFSLYRDGCLAMWACGRVTCICSLDLPHSTGGESGRYATEGVQSHMLRKAHDSVDSQLLLAVYLCFAAYSEIVLVKPVHQPSGSFKLDHLVTIQTPANDLVEMALSSRCLWSMWRGVRGCIQVFRTVLGTENRGWEMAHLEPPPDIEESLYCDMGVADRYLSYIFDSGRFSVAVISRALSLFRRSNLRPEAALSYKKLRDRVLLAVGEEIAGMVEGLEKEDLLEIQSQCWFRFYSDCVEYNEASSRPVGLTLIGESGVVLIKRQQYSLLRPMEILEHLLLCNSSDFPGGDAVSPGVVSLMGVLGVLEIHTSPEMKANFELLLEELCSPEQSMDQLLQGEALLEPSFLQDVGHKLQTVGDVYRAIIELIQILTVAESSEDEDIIKQSISQMPKLHPALACLYGSNTGNSVVTQSLKQMMAVSCPFCFSSIVMIVIPSMCFVIEYFIILVRNEPLSINLLQAMDFISAAWKQESSSTTSNCFREAVVLLEEATSNDDYGDEVLSGNELMLPEGVEVDTFVHFDINLAVCGELPNEEIIADVCQQRGGDGPATRDSDIGDEDNNLNLETPELSEVLSAIDVCRRYINAKICSENVLNSLLSLQKLSVCRNLLVLSYLLLEFWNHLGVRAEMVQLDNVRSILVPRCVVLSQAYYSIAWFSNTMVSLPLGNTPDSTDGHLAVLGLGKLSHIHPVNLWPHDWRPQTVLELLIQSTRAAPARALLEAQKLNEDELSLWPCAMVQFVVSLGKFVWPMCNYSAIPQLLLTLGQYRLVQEYVRLLMGWCEWNSFLRLFMLGAALLYSNEPQKSLIILQKVARRDAANALLNHLGNQAQKYSVLIEYYLLIIEMFSKLQHWDCVLKLAQSALVHAMNSSELVKLHMIAFDIHLKQGNHAEAFNSLTAIEDKESSRLCLHQLVITMFDRRLLEPLMEFPQQSMLEDLQEVVLSRARAADLQQSYYDFLYAFHMRQGNVRKAADAMVEQGLRLGQDSNPTIYTIKHQADCYLAGMNSLRLAAPNYAWIVKPKVISKLGGSEAESEKDESPRSPKRRVEGAEIFDMEVREQIELMEVSDIEREYDLVSARLALIKLDPSYFTSVVSQLSPLEVVTACTNAGLYEVALSIAKQFSLPFEPILAHLAHACVDMTKQGLKNAEETWAWLKENDVWEFGIGDANALNLSWKLLEVLIKRYEKPHQSSLHKAVTRVLLQAGFFLPHWLMASYRRINSAELLREYLAAGRLEEASHLAQQLMWATLGRSKEEFGLTSSLAPGEPYVYVPLHTIDRLVMELRIAAEESPQTYSELLKEVEKVRDRYTEEAMQVSQHILFRKSTVRGHS
ncbi:nuclear pore complex protein Nup160 [Anabrus simplex]|uniref:nuclear pore complex protein Nup160 n=1 Tax=Anabrus simplex TaxID=316456 RepID=UPI0035A2E0B4